MLISKVVIEWEARIRDRVKYHLPLTPIKDEIVKAIDKLHILLVFIKHLEGTRKIR